MSGATSYADYIATLAERFAVDVSRSVPHRDAIEAFCQAILPLGLAPSIYVCSDGELSLTAVVVRDYAAQMLALMQAGYEVGDPVMKDIQYNNETTWRAPVSGHGLAFNLSFTTKKD